MNVHQRIAANRLLLADFFEALSEDQLDTRSLCAAWSVREVLAHIAMPLMVGLPRVLVGVVRHRGNIDSASVEIARDLAQHDLTALVNRLRDGAGRHVPAPGVGPMGQMADGCIHLRDCARPLGLHNDVPLSDWRMVLDWLPSRQARLGVVPKGRLAGLLLRATDQPWHWGHGAPVVGDSEALAMAVAGREVALVDLTGRGVPLLAQRLSLYRS